MVDPALDVADDLSVFTSPVEPLAGEPEAGFAPGHAADVHQGVRNGTFREPPPFPDLPLDDLTNKLPGFSVGQTGSGTWTFRRVIDADGLPCIELDTPTLTNGDQVWMEADSIGAGSPPAIGNATSATVRTIVGKAPAPVFLRTQYLAAGVAVDTEAAIDTSFATVVWALAGTGVTGARPATADALRVRLQVDVTADDATGATYQVRGVANARLVSRMYLGDPSDPTHATAFLQFDAAIAGLFLLRAGSAAHLQISPGDSVAPLAKMGGSGPSGAGEITVLATGDIVLDPQNDVTVAGALVLAGDPAAALQAATKQYVDAAIPTSLPPSGGAGGVLSGSYPNPGFAVDMATQAELDAHAAAANPHSVYATDADLAAHEADSTAIHGITDTSTLYRAGGTDVAIADGGTGASDAAGARSNLGLGALAVLAQSGLDFAEAGDIAAVGPTAAAGASTEIPPADHVHPGVGLAPTASQTVTATGGTGVTPLILQGAASQAVEFFKILDSAAATVANVGPTGAVLVRPAGAGAGIDLEQYRSDFRTQITLKRSKSDTRGTHTALVSGDEAAAIVGFGSDGTAFRQVASILMTVDGTVGASDMPGRMSLATTPDGSAVAVERVRIDNTGMVELKNGVKHSGIISPAALAANTDNYDPTGGGAYVWRLSATTSSRNLTGILAEAGGVEHLLFNVGSIDIVLVHDATSTAANRFYCPNSANLTLNPNDGVRIWYDATSARWRVLGV